jgi:hypothetical protein
MELKSSQTIWASVAIVFMLIASTTALVILGKDVTIILTLAALVAIPVLGAFGVSIHQKLDQVKEASNGNLAKAMDMSCKTQDQLTALAMSMTPPVTPVVVPVPTSVPPVATPPAVLDESVR